MSEHDSGHPTGGRPASGDGTRQPVQLEVLAGQDRPQRGDRPRLGRAGCALLAPAGHHLMLARNGDGSVVARLGLRPVDTPHRPAVDVLFRSAADVYGDRTLGVVLTGMGSDGTQGAAWIKAQGGRVFTEAEESCVVYGMPRSVVEAGLSDRVVPLPRMAEAILGAL